MQDERARETPGCAIAVMAKASIPGRTKTRLIPPLTPEQAADLNTAFLRDVADNLLAAAALANISAWMAYTPAGSRDFFAGNLPPASVCIETVEPDFGACLFRAADALLAAGHESACLLNSDSPTLPTGYLVAAATALAAPGDRVVLGPATDGGYYLIGIKQPHRRLFQDVDWSTERVLRQTLARADELGLPVVRAAELVRCGRRGRAAPAHRRAGGRPALPRRRQQADAGRLHAAPPVAAARDIRPRVGHRRAARSSLVA